MTFTQTSVDAFSKLALAQFQTLFWDVCKTNGWTLSDMEDEVSPKTLDNMLTQAMLNGPSTKVISDKDNASPKEIEQLPTQQPRKAQHLNQLRLPLPQRKPLLLSPCLNKKVKGLKFKGANVDLLCLA